MDFIPSSCHFVTDQMDISNKDDGAWAKLSEVNDLRELKGAIVSVICSSMKAKFTKSILSKYSG